MKKFPLLLAFSLGANAALVAAWVLHSSGPLPTASTLGAGAGSAPASSRREANLVPAALAETGTLAQLKAAGLSESAARDLIVGRASLRLQEKQRLARGDDRNEYWKNNGAPSREIQAALRRASREYRAELMAAGLEDPYFENRRDFLPPAKRDQMRRIVDDYTDMLAQAYADMHGFNLPSDQEKIRLLQQEQQRDIAAVLSPEELEQYNLRNSRTANNVRMHFGDAIQSEDEYRKIYAAQKAYDDAVAPGDRMASTVRGEDIAAAEQKFTDDLRASLGETEFAALRRATDPDYRNLSLLAGRFNLPAGTADTLLASRDSYAALSQQINQDEALAPQDRAAQLKQLGARAVADFQTALGTEAANAYVQRASWINLLKSGTAFSTETKPQAKFSAFSPSVTAVAPPRPRGK